MFTLFAAVMGLGIVLGARGLWSYLEEDGESIAFWLMSLGVGLFIFGLINICK